LAPGLTVPVVSSIAEAALPTVLTRDLLAVFHRACVGIAAAQKGHRGAGGPDVPLNLAQGCMTGNCRDLVRGAPCLGEAARSCLAEAMRVAMTKVRHIALATKPIRESDARERFPEFCHQKRHVPARSAIDSRTQLTANRN
jgi:hypothetical protein